MDEEDPGRDWAAAALAEASEPLAARTLARDAGAEERAAAFAAADVVLMLSPVGGALRAPLEAMHCGATPSSCRRPTPRSSSATGRTGSSPSPTTCAASPAGSTTWRATASGWRRCARARAATAAGWPDWDAASAELAGALERLVAEPPPERAAWPVRLMADAMAGAAVFRNDHFVLAGELERVQNDEAYQAAAALRDRLRGTRLARVAAPAARAGAQAPGVSRLRVAFVGQEMYFAVVRAAARRPAASSPRSSTTAAGRTATRCARAWPSCDPDVVVVFRPEIVAPGLFDDLDALTLGFTTEPLPRDGAPHADQLVRLRELAEADPTQFDRVVTFDPLSAAAAAAFVPVWRSLALPVDDRFFAPGGRRGAARRGSLFVAYATEHRERFLIDAKHEFDLLHVAWGLHGDALRERFARTDVALNVHHGPYPSFENRVLLHLAAGHWCSASRSARCTGCGPASTSCRSATPEELRRDHPSRPAPTPQGFDRGPPARGAAAPSGSAPRGSGRALIGDLVRDVRLFGGRTAHGHQEVEVGVAVAQLGLCSARRRRSRRGTRRPTRTLPCAVTSTCSSPKASPNSRASSIGGEAPPVAAAAASSRLDLADPGHRGEQDAAGAPATSRMPVTAARTS